MSDANALRAAGADGDEDAAERMWHVRRALAAAFFLAFMALVAGLALHETGYDIYLDATLGRITASEGLSAQSGIAAMTRPDAPRIGWLWQVIAYGVTRLGGLGAVTVVCALIAACGFAVVLAQAARRLNVVIAGALLLALAYLARLYMTPDAQAAGVFLFGVMLVLLANSIDSAGRRVWLVVPLMALWVNLDFTWFAGAALVAAFLVITVFSATPRKAEKVAALAVALVATLLNPDFHRAWEVLRLPYPLESPEAWINPIAGPAVRSREVLFALVAVGILLAIASMSRAALAAAAAAVVVSVGRLSVGAFPVASLAAGASIVLSLSLLVPRLARGAKGEGGDWLRKWLLPLVLTDAEACAEPEAAAADAARASAGSQEIVHRRMVYGLGAVLAGFGVLAVFTLIAYSVLGSRKYPFGVGVSSALAPDKAIAFAKKNGLTGVALVHPKWAGCFLASEYPRARMLYDPRILATTHESAELAGQAFAAEAKRPAEEVAGALLAGGMRFALVPQQWTRSIAMVRFWTPVYWDDRAAVFVPNLKENADFILAHDERLTFPAYLVFNMRPDRLPAIIAALEKKVAEDPDSALARYHLGMAFYMKKDYIPAAMQLLLALGNDPALATAYHTLGDIVRATKNPQVAHAAMAVVTGSRVMMEAMAGVPREGDAIYDAIAVALHTQAVALDPNLAMAYVRLGNIYVEKGQLARALTALTAAKEADKRRPQLEAIRPGLSAELDRQIAAVSGAFTQRRPGGPGIDSTGASPALETTAPSLQLPAESPVPVESTAGLEGGNP